MPEPLLPERAMLESVMPEPAMSEPVMPDSATPLASTEATGAAAAAATTSPRAGGVHFALVAIATVTVVAALWAAKGLLMPVAFAVLLTLLLAPVVGFIARWGIPRWLASVFVVSLSLALVVVAVSQLATPAERWLNPRSPEWRKLETQIRALKQPLERIRGAQDRVADIAEPAGKPKPREVVVEKRDIMTTLSEFQSIAIGAVSAVVLLFFLLASDDFFLRKLIRVLPTLGDKKTAVGIARTIQSEIGRYFATVAMSNIGLAAATAALMALIGMPSPIFWGAVVGLLNFVPYLGAAVSLVLLTAAAAVSLEGWSIVAVPASFLVLTTLEGQIIQPLLVGRRMELNVVVTFLSVMFGGWLWGLGGLFIAVPTLVVLKICADHIETMGTLGEFISRE